MRLRRLIAVLGVLAVAGTSLAACGGDDDDSSSDADTSETTATDDGGDDTGSDSTGDTGSDELDELLAKQNDANIRITYELDSGTVTIAHDGTTDPPRSSMLQDGTLTISTGEGNAISCDGVDGDSPTCTELPLGGDFIATTVAAIYGGLGSFLVATGDGADLPFVDVDTSTEEIAGREAECVTWDLSSLGEAFAGQLGGNAAGFSGCFDTETGWVLSYEVTDGDGNTVQALEATEVEETSDADFEPPVTPETMPDIGDISIPSVPS